MGRVMENIEGLYFDWLCSFVYDNRYYKNLSYARLLQYLDLREFYDKHPRDESRIADGIDLRYRFGREKNIDRRIIATELDIYPCRILEMMVALCLRMEESIMDDPAIGNRTSQWFWEMISSMGLSGMTDRNFDVGYVNDILYNFLERNYAPNGKGGLFTLQNPTEDQRYVEIWYQMNQYLREILA